MDKFTIVFVHGTGGHDADWFPNIAKELKSRQVLFEIPALPNQLPIQVETWLSGLHNTVKQIETPIVFVGYSLGTRTILLYLENHNLTVKHVFLVAAFSNEIKDTVRGSNEYPSFFTHAINTEIIRKKVENITILHSTDDDSIPYEQAVELSKELGAELLTYQDKGHFYRPEYSKDILSVLEEKLGI